MGQCAKGFKCKFSHDLNVQRKGEKIDIYSDKRDEGDFQLNTQFFCFCFFFVLSVYFSSYMILIWWVLVYLRHHGGLGSRDT